MADTLEFGLDFGRAHDMAVRLFAEIEFDAGPEEPVERNLVDGHHRLTVDGFRLEMNRRIHMRAVMGGERNLLDRPGLAFRQIFRLEARKMSHKSGAVSLLLLYSIFGRMNG